LPRGRPVRRAFRDDPDGPWIRDVRDRTVEEVAGGVVPGRCDREGGGPRLYVDADGLRHLERVGGADAGRDGPTPCREGCWRCLLQVVEEVVEARFRRVDRLQAL